MDCKYLSIIEGVRLPVDQTLNGCQLLKNEYILVLLAKVDVSQIRIQQVVVHLWINLVRRLQIHYRA